MLRLCLATLTLLLACSPGVSASNCDSIRTQIEAKVRASGVKDFVLSTVEADAKVTGKIVGSCDLGLKKIVYIQSAAGAASQAKPRRAEERIVTECKDGSVSGDCKK